MTRKPRYTPSIDAEAVANEVSRVEDLSDRVRVSGYGLAAPLVTARDGQMQREAERTARRKGADHPDVARQQGNSDRAQVRFALLEEEKDRVRLTRPSFDNKDAAGIWGRVVDDGVPQNGLSVSAIGDGVRLDFDCTDAVGGFSIEVPADTALYLSVRSKDGTELYRDPEPLQLCAGQLLYREVDLTRGAQMPCPAPDDDGGEPPLDTFDMVGLVGQPEATATAVLKTLGLKISARSTQPSDGPTGVILSHDPAEGAAVQRGDAVALVVSASLLAGVPDLVGLPLNTAQELLKKSGLIQGSLSQIIVKNEREGLIVDQAPASGARVARGSAVDLSIGVRDDTEPTLIPVPDIVGENQDSAQEILKASGLAIGAASTLQVTGEKVGLVITQHPGAGSEVLPDTPVNLVLGIPIDDDVTDIIVPDLKQRTLKDAEAILASAGLSLGATTDVPGPDNQIGLVLAQSPHAGKVAQPGDPVAVDIGAKSDDVVLVTVPLVRGTPRKSALREIRKVGLVGEATQTSVTAQALDGIVLTQNPAGSSTAALGSIVSIEIGVLVDIPPDTVDVPDLKGMGRSDVETSLKNADLTVGAITIGSSKPNAKGLVIGQSPKAGEKVERRSAVDFRLGSGKQQGGGVTLDPDVAEIAAMAEASLARSPPGLGGEQPGIVAQRLQAAGIKSLGHLDEALLLKRTQRQSLFNLPTLAELDRFCRALKRARKKLIG